MEEELRQGTLLKVTELESNFGKLLGISKLLMEHSDKIHIRNTNLENTCAEAQ